MSDEALREFLGCVEKGCDFQDASDEDLQSKKEIKTYKESIVSEFELERKVYAELKKELILYYGYKQDPSRLDARRASWLIDQLEPKEYDNILVKILTKILPSSKITGTEIEEWKQIIQTKISSHLESISQKLKKNTKKEQKDCHTITKPRNTERKQKSISTGRKQGTCIVRRKKDDKSFEKHGNWDFCSLIPKVMRLCLKILPHLEKMGNASEA